MREGDEWVVAWRVTPEGPLHVSRTPAAPPTDTPAQLVDALFAEHRDKLLAEAWAERARNGGPLEQGWPVVMFDRICGESALVGNAGVARALESSSHPSTSASDWRSRPTTGSPPCR